MTTSRVTTSTGNQVLSRSTTYEYLKINQSLVTKKIPRSKVSAPQGQYYNTSSGMGGTGTKRTEGYNLNRPNMSKGPR